MRPFWGRRDVSAIALPQIERQIDSAAQAIIILYDARKASVYIIIVVLKYALLYFDTKNYIHMNPGFSLRT